MSRKGDFWDKAMSESFFAVMKTELVHHEQYEGHQDGDRELKILEWPPLYV